MKPFLFSLIGLFFLSLNANAVDLPALALSEVLCGDRTTPIVLGNTEVVSVCVAEITDTEMEALVLYLNDGSTQIYPIVLREPGLTTLPEGKTVSIWHGYSSGAESGMFKTLNTIKFERTQPFDPTFSLFAGSISGTVPVSSGPNKTSSFDIKVKYVPVIQTLDEN